MKLWGIPFYLRGTNHDQNHLRSLNPFTAFPFATFPHFSKLRSKAQIPSAWTTNGFPFCKAHAAADSICAHSRNTSGTVCIKRVYHFDIYTHESQKKVALVNAFFGPCGSTTFETCFRQQNQSITIISVLLLCFWKVLD